MNNEDRDNILRISSNSNPARVAGAIAARFKDFYNTNGDEAVVDIQAVGPYAVNQAIKAIVLARGYLLTSGISTCVIPTFDEDIKNDGKKVSLIRLLLCIEKN